MSNFNNYNSESNVEDFEDDESKFDTQKDFHGTIWIKNNYPAWSKKFIDFICSDLFIPIEKPQILITGAKEPDLINHVFKLINEEGRIIIIEKSSIFLDGLRKNFEDEIGKKIFFKHDRSEKLNFAQNVFDTIISSLAWMEEFDSKKIVKEFNRVLNYNSSIYLSGYLRGTFQELYDLFEETTLKFDYREQRKALIKDYNSVLTTDDVENLLRSAGFQNIDISTKDDTLWFENGDELFSSGFLKKLYLPKWRAVLGNDESFFDRTRYAFSTYFEGKKVPITIKLFKVRARKGMY